MAYVTEIDQRNKLNAVEGAGVEDEDGAYEERARNDGSGGMGPSRDRHSGEIPAFCRAPGFRTTMRIPALPHTARSDLFRGGTNRLGPPYYFSIPPKQGQGGATKYDGMWAALFDEKAGEDDRFA